MALMAPHSGVTNPTQYIKYDALPTLSVHAKYSCQC